MRNKARKEFPREDYSLENTKPKQGMRHSQVTPIGNAPFCESPDEKKRRTEDWQSAQDEVSNGLIFSFYYLPTTLHKSSPVFH